MKKTFIFISVSLLSAFVFINLLSKLWENINYVEYKINQNGVSWLPAAFLSISYLDTRRLKVSVFKSSEADFLSFVRNAGLIPEKIDSYIGLEFMTLDLSKPFPSEIYDKSEVLKNIEVKNGWVAFSDSENQYILYVYDTSSGLGYINSSL